MPRKKKAKGNGRAVVTAYIPAELVDKVKNIVYWTPGLTVASFAGAALKSEVAKCEEKRGESFPTRRRS